jgi:hypothetical protein
VDISDLRKTSANWKETKPNPKEKRKQKQLRLSKSNSHRHVQKTFNGNMHVIEHEIEDRNKNK